MKSSKLSAEIKKAEQEKKKILFRFRGFTLEVDKTDSSGKELIVILTEKSEWEHGTCRDCKTSASLLYGRCGVCWTEHERKIHIEQANNYVDVP